MPEILHGSYLNLTTVLQTRCVGHVVFRGIMFFPSVFFWTLPPQPILYKHMVRLMFVVLSEFWDKKEYRRLLWIFLNSRDGKRLGPRKFFQPSVKGDGENGVVLGVSAHRGHALVSSREGRGPAIFLEKKCLQKPYRQVGPLATSEEDLRAPGRAWTHPECLGPQSHADGGKKDSTCQDRWLLDHMARGLELHRVLR